MALYLTGGALNRRRLATAPAGVRPTQNRVREAVFSSLATRIPGCRFLDLFAGTGSVALEAWSRGAEEVIAVEKDRKAATALEQGRDALGVPAAQLRVLRSDAARVVEGRSLFAADVVYLDPPYPVTDEPEGLHRLLARLAESGWTTDETAVLVETAGASRWQPPEPWRIRQERRYGAARVCWLERGVGAGDGITA